MSRDQMSSDDAGNESTAGLREQFAQAFDRSTDPLEEYSDAFAELPDPFEYFIIAVIQNRDQITKSQTVEDYERTYEQWRDFMATTERHPACPSIKHVKSFVEWRRDVHNNSPDYIKIKFSYLNQAYEHWQRESVFPHPTDYNPFEIAREEISFGNDAEKTFPDLSLQDIRRVFGQITNIRGRALVGIQLKLGLRAGEVFNLQLQDIHVSHSGLHDCYPELGTHPALGDYTDVIYIPPDREGNKSSVPRLLPIDSELRWLLIRHLLTRPQVDRPWVFLSKRSFDQMNYTAINRPWKEAFHPEYAETEETRAITSHFGRHWFSSYCRLKMGLEREHVQYMRGDLIEPINEFADAIDDYLHPQYEHIETDYRQDIFTFNIQMGHNGR